ncbi:hypothetical protein GCM10007858_61830 [Bradyrhizobium liaoningense]|nr:hypothetical protein GCM10007858_61830 [Bradyrhizobium liaoningense]
MKAAAVVGDDAGGFLAAVLKGVKAERGDGGRIGVTVDAEHAALLAQRIPLQIVLKLQRGRARTGVGIEIKLGVLVRGSHLVRASL